ncbi:hydrogenase maturation nickel metallochaperone HypA/HybF [Risungbinella massiliensis]|uniref:hydrogenase maturation nickel metallochaperone HypA/HybF n=1 Tax=Risungbinella massiliensis TaxID=1329796 RepID=UPI0005CC8923
MHEMSLMSEIVKLVSDDASLKGFKNIENIEVIVGELSNVLPDALELAFYYFQRKRIGMINENTQLHIKREKAKAKCQTCQLEFEPDYQIALCPECKLANCLLISGETFRVESYEGRGTHEN